MCGICGIATSKEHKRALSSEIIALNQKIEHRGPDGEGYLLYDGNITQKLKGTKSSHLPINSIEPTAKDYQLALGHQKLSIIDLTDQSHQPMVFEDQYWIVFNGAIYNFQEIKADLKQKGYSFESNSDTEVILVAYKAYGSQCVDYFNGMFSFVIFDQENNSLFGARDRYGVKPFYYIQKEDIFYFSSEVNGLRNIAGIDYHIREDKSFDWLVFNIQEENEDGILSPIKELMPGHFFNLCLNTFKLNIKRYFKTEITAPNSYTFEENSDRIHDLVSKAIKQNLIGDQKIGTCLSGGIDSTIIAAIMSQNSKEKVHSFTASFPGFALDEKTYAKEAVDAFNLEAHWTYPNANELREAYHDFIKALDLPVWSTSTFAQWQLMKLAKESKIKVLLNGQGADEIFGGYRHHFYYAYQSTKDTALLNDVYVKGDYRKERIKQWALSGNNSVITKAYLNHILKEFKWLDRDFIHRNLEDALDRQRQRFKPSSWKEKLNADLNNGALKSFLRCEDRVSMRFGIESRVPFASDQGLISEAIALPIAHQIDQGGGKKMLKAAFKNQIPSKIFYRKDKIGLVTPNNQWIRAIEDIFNGKNYDPQFYNTSFLGKNLSNIVKNLSETENGRTFKYLTFNDWLK